jgi:RNA polymerase sigma-70 factor (ECF subfamily)
MAINEGLLLQQLREPKKAQRAFAVLVKEYTEPLYWHLRRMVLDHDDANDLLQNTFIKAWTNIDGFQGNSKISTWLYRIATNEALTFLNRQNATDFISLDDEDAAPVNLEADEYFDGDDLQRRLQEALQTLPPKQRMVFNMKYFDEMKYEDMSEVLGTSVGALKASYHLAVQKIAAFFQDDI